MRKPAWKNSYDYPLSSLDRNYWLFNRKTVTAARRGDLKYATVEELGWIAIWASNGTSPPFLSHKTPSS